MQILFPISNSKMQATNLSKANNNGEWGKLHVFIYVTDKTMNLLVKLGTMPDVSIVFYHCRFLSTERSTLNTKRYEMAIIHRN